MKTSYFKINLRFLGKWILAVSIAWPVGIILAIILSYTIVNLFYSKETNLIVGLCIGGVTGLAQWLVLKKSFKVSILWIFSGAIGFGIPFAMRVIFDEIGTVPLKLLNNENLSLLIVSCIGGCLTGLLQIPALKSLAGYSGLWVAINTFGWGITMLPNLITDDLGFMIGGVLLGVVTGFPILFLLPFPQEETLV